MQNIAKRIARLLLHRLLPECPQKSWNFLRYYPHVIPTTELFLSWQQSEWTEYQKWIDRHSVRSLDQWQTLHKQAKKWKHFPKVSIVTPVYNTDAATLRLCILSVRIQTSPFWELILVDDGSSNKATIEVLNSRLCKDPRIHVLRSGTDKGTGISAATNRGIDSATGDFIIFLDHDDRLAPEAIQSVSEALRSAPDLDIVYSDRDMISEAGKRFMYLMKPDWSPENLYSANYIFHLMCYRKQLLLDVGKLRSEYDGGQDHDLILRCMEHTTKIKHIPEILYHYRSHDQSMATNEEAKSYAYTAGIKAIEDALRRRQISGTVSEIDAAWRGNYQVKLPPCNREEIGLITIRSNSSLSEYVESVLNSSIIQKGKQPFIFIQHEDYQQVTPAANEIMAAWLKMDKIAIVSACTVNNENRYLYTGTTYDSEGNITRPYYDHPTTEPGHMAVNKIVRNISAPDPYSVVFRRELWEELNGFTEGFLGPHALLDFALKCLQTKSRIIYNPQVIFQCTNNVFRLTSPPPKQDMLLFKQRWRKWLQKGDPYYSPNLSKQSDCYELNHSQ